MRPPSSTAKAKHVSPCGSLTKCGCVVSGGFIDNVIDAGFFLVHIQPKVNGSRYSNFIELPQRAFCALRVSFMASGIQHQSLFCVFPRQCFMSCVVSESHFYCPSNKIFAILRNFYVRRLMHSGRHRRK